MRQADRAIDWLRDNTAMIVRKVRAADSAPGVRGSSRGKTCYFYGVHEEERLQGLPGQILARRNGAVCIGTIDGAVWISHLKVKDSWRNINAIDDLTFEVLNTMSHLVIA